MNVCDLIKAIEEYPDFEVELSHVVREEGKWPVYNTYKVVGVADVGHSSKVIILDIGESDNSIIIPNNATNGDMIKAMFPKCEQKEHINNNGYFEMYFDNDLKNADYMRVSKKWWNALYKGSEG